MSIEDQRRWDDRYRRATPPGEPRPPAALEGSGVAVASIGHAPIGHAPTVHARTGRALDVACGQGAVSVWLAQQGFMVLGVDVSPVAVASARSLAATYGVADSSRFEVADLDVGLPEGLFDVMVCQRFRDRARYPDLAAAVAPGGMLLVTVLSSVGHAAVGHAGDPVPFRAAPGELVDAFAGRLEVLWSSEAEGESHLVARRR